MPVRQTKEDFIEKSTKVHGDRYDYSKVIYVNNRTKVCIICREHGEFWQYPRDHVRGVGCPLCGGHAKLDTESFIEKAKKVHGGKYDYSKVSYENSVKKVCITCPEHGDFQQAPSYHLQGNGCPICGNNVRSNTSEFITKVIKIYGDRYDYSDVDYVNAMKKVRITCPKHGVFLQRPNDHLNGYSCPVCGSHASKSEEELSQYIGGLIGPENVIRRTKSVLGGQELDIYIPSRKMAIEYDGLYWHSEAHISDRNYHLSKTMKCAEKGIRLIHIFEDEYLCHKEIVLNKIRHILGCDSDRESVGGRKCLIRHCSKREARDFLNRHHIQGFKPSTLYIGAVYKDKLVGVMSFIREDKEGTWNLTRFATTDEYRLPGLARRMLVYFMRNNDYTVIKTFLDRRWNLEGNSMYERIGFTLVGIEKPDYYYTDSNGRYHKFMFRKAILSKKYGYPMTMTEHEMALNAGYYRIWNCGLAKYEIRK